MATSPAVTTQADTDEQKPKYSAENLGPNNEGLAEVYPELVASLRELTNTLKSESITARRYQLRRAMEAKYYWQGLQYLSWNAQENSLRVLTSGAMDTPSDLGQLPRYQYVTNFYQAFGLTFIAVISQSLPTVRFYPVKPSNGIDVTTAKAASEIASLIERNNRAQDQLTDVGYILWTDSYIGAYVRYVSDAEKFGSTNRNVLEEQDRKMGQDVYVCPQCGAETPVEQSQGACPQCGAPLTPDDIKPAQTATVAAVVGTEQKPNGQEVITYVGGLELHTPPGTNTQKEFPYLNWSTEVDKAKLMDLYPDVAEKIGGGSGSSTGANDLYGRIARTTIKQNLPYMLPGDVAPELITFSRTWLRPWAFNRIQKKDIRDQLKKLFPNGCYAAFAGETYCESRNENMDECWRTMKAMPGDGQGVPAVGESTIDIQEQYNNLSNIEAETYEYGIPPVIAEEGVMDPDALENQVAEPAAWYFAKAKQGKALADSFFQPAPATVPDGHIKRRQELMGPIAQFLSGLFPAIFGGETDSQTTATQYSMMREQAMGRLGLIWRRLRAFYAEVMLLAVQTFIQNRSEDIEMAVMNDDGQFGSKYVRMADLKGNITVQEEADESYPAMKSQQRTIYQQLLANPDPAVQAILAQPQNLSTIKTAFGLEDLVIPGEDARIKQLREIKQMLQTSVPLEIDPLLDDNAAELAEGKRWANSDEGQATKEQNPQGFEAVREHLQMHQTAMRGGMVAPQGPQPGMVQ